MGMLTRVITSLRFYHPFKSIFSGRLPTFAAGDVPIPLNRLNVQNIIVYLKIAEKIGGGEGFTSAPPRLCILALAWFGPQILRDRSLPLGFQVKA
ncbi:MAG: hypothetical protein QW176_06075 [Candidatus Bathyarchaeia archaeon]